MATSALTALETRLRGLLKAGTLVINRGLINAAPLDSFLGTLPSQRLGLNNAEIKLSANEPTPTLTITGQTPQSWPIKGISNEGLKNINIELKIVAGRAASTFDAQLGVGGNLTIDGQAISVTGNLSEKGSLHLSLGTPGAQSTSLSRLAAFAGASQMVGFLPEGIELFNQVKVRGIDLQFGLGATDFTSLSFTVGTDLDWEVVPGLITLKSVGAMIRANHYPTDSKKLNSSFGGSIDAVAHLGEDFQIVVYVQDKNNWEIEIVPDEDGRLPGLSALATLAGGSALANSVQNGLDTLGFGELSILDVKIGVDLVRKKLSFVYIMGQMTIDGLGVDVSVRLPDLQLTGRLAKGSQVSIKSLVQNYFSGADEFPAINITDFVVTAYPKTAAYSVYAAVTNDWTLDAGGVEFALQGLSLGLEKSRAGVSGSALAMTVIAGVELSVSAAYAAAEGWVFKGNIPRLNLSALARDLLAGTPLPDELPDLEFTNINISLAPQTGAFTLQGRCTASWDLPFGVSGLAVTTVDIDLQRGASTGTGAQRVPGPVSCSLKLNGDGPVTIVDGLVFKQVALSFDLLDQGVQKSWTLAGAISARVFETDYTLAASLEQTPALRKINLTAAATTPALVNLDGVGSLSGKGITINITKALRPAAAASTGTTTGTGTGTTGTPGTSVSLSPTSPYTWDVTIAGGMKINNVFDIQGTLQLYRQTDRTGLAFRAQKAEVEIPLPVPQQSIKFHLGLGYISIVRTTGAAGAAATWAFDAAVDVWFTGLPQSVQKILAQKVVGQFRADGIETQVSINRVLQPIEVDVPDVKTGSLTIEFGKMLLDASNLMLRIKGGQLILSMDFGVGLPEGLNNVFGTKADGTPSTRFFNTYQKDKPETISKFRLGIDTTSGLTIQTVTSPIAAVKLVVEGQNTWWNVDLGDFGKIKLMVPVFSYTGDSFVARGGFQQIEPLKVPLTPLKLLLSAAGLEAASKALPNGIPLQDLDIYDEKTESFKFEEFINTLETLGGFRLPPEATDALRLIESRLDALPDRFKSYFDIEIPDRFEFNISITPDGGARGKIWVTGDKPIKLLYPTMGLLGPVMTGIELYSVTFGEILGGSLLLLNLDLRIDQYDLLQLVAALALPLDKLPILPDTRSLSRHLIVKNLFMLVIYQAVIPIPVPLFFDELGLEYLGLEGLALQTHWGFPRPRLNPSDASRIFKDFESFFTTPDHLLDADTPPEGLDLQLVVGPNYVQLPEYLGGKSLGSKDEKTVVSVYQNLAHLLNALKTLSLNELIQALPLDKRVGKEQVSFACMRLETDWLITTPQEFRSLSYRQLKVAESEIDDILQIVPATAGKNLEGLIILLKGNWQIASAFSLATCFGLVGTEQGFATGLGVDGKLSDLLAVEIAGTVVINTKGPNYFGMSGHSAMTILERQVFVGDVQIDDTHFFLNGQLSVFPPSSPLQIGGGATIRIDNQGQVFFQGAVNVSLQNFILQGSQITLTNTSLAVSASWLGRSVTFSIVVQGRDFILSGSVGFDLGLNFNTGAIIEPKTGLKLTDGISLNTQANTSLAVSLGNFGFTAEVNASFKWNDLCLQVPQFRIDASPADVTQLTNMLADKIREKASEIFANVYKGVNEWLKAAAAGIIQLSAEWRDAVAAARKWSNAAWNATAQWSTKAWQSASRWKASAWRATTRWSDQAWKATTEWTDDAWGATVAWTDESWNATTKWSDDAWRATTHWSKDAWQATTHWSEDTWKDTTRWTKDVWDNTAHWTTDEWNNATKTVEKFFKSIHGDVTFIPHLDTEFIPHLDTMAIPHVDAQAASHGDMYTIPHADGHPIPHGDRNVIPHLDGYAIPHGDKRGVHADVDKKKVAGKTIIPHTDEWVGHIDVRRSGHADTAETAHVDIRAVHADSPRGGHLDTPNVLHGDTRAVAHLDTPSTAHGDIPGQAHIDT
jgi:hypothetical protein